MDAEQRRSVAGYAVNIVFPAADGTISTLDRRHAAGLYRQAGAAAGVTPDFTKRNMAVQDNRAMAVQDNRLMAAQDSRTMTTQDNRTMAVQDNRTMTVIEE